MPKMQLPISFRQRAEEKIRQESGLTTDDLYNLLTMIVDLEHQTDRKIPAEQYQSVFNLACTLHGVPTWYKHYFGRKAAEAAERQ